MTRAGLDPTLKLNGIEMINALAAKYEATVDLQLAAAEFGLKAEAFRDAAAAGGQKALSLVRRLDQGLVPRDQFEADFAVLVPNITDDEALTAGSGPALDVARVGAGSKDVARSFDLSLTSDRNAYRQNDPAVFTVVSQEDCSLTLINVDAKGVGTVLFPNKFQPDSFIRARQEFRFGDSATPFKFRLADRGTETVIAVCNASKKSTRELEADFKANGFTDLGNYAARLTRQIALEAREAKAHARQIRVEEAQSSKSQATRRQWSAFRGLVLGSEGVAAGQRRDRRSVGDQDRSPVESSAIALQALELWRTSSMNRFWSGVVAAMLLTPRLSRKA